MIVRTWRWLFPTRSLSLELHADLSHTVDALRSRIASRGLRTLFHEGMVGRVDETGLSVRYQRSWSHNDFSPVFIGRFATVNGRLCLVGEFQARRGTRVFLGFWIAFVFLWWIGAFVGTIASTTPGIPWPIVLIVPPAMMAFAIGLCRVGHWFAESDVGRIESGLRDAVAAGSAFASRAS